MLRSRPDPARGVIEVKADCSAVFVFSECVLLVAEEALTVSVSARQQDYPMSDFSHLTTVIGQQHALVTSSIKVGDGALLRTSARQAMTPAMYMRVVVVII